MDLMSSTGALSGTLVGGQVGDSLAYGGNQMQNVVVAGQNGNYADMSN